MSTLSGSIDPDLGLSGPIKIVAVRRYSLEPLDPKAVELDAAGRFCIGSIEPGIYDIYVQREVDLVEGDNNAKVMLPAQSKRAQIGDAELALNFGPLGQGRIQGKALHEREPVAGAYVYAHRIVEGEDSWQILGSTTTDTAGFYELTRLPEGPLMISVDKIIQPKEEGAFSILEASDSHDLRAQSDISYQAMLDLRTSRPLKPGETAPDFEGTTTDGRLIRFSDYRGKVVLLDFWSTGCQLCVEDLPNTEGLYRKYQDKGLEALGITLDTNREWLEEFLKRRTSKYPQLFDSDGNASTKQGYGVAGIPQLFLVDKEGMVRATGYLAADLETGIKDLLQE